MERIVYREIAGSIDAMRNCIAHHDEPGKGHLTDWISRHAERAQSLTREYLPSGSGIDNGVTIDVEKSTGEKLVFYTAYHHMNDAGYYDGWTEHTVTVRASLAHGLDIKISGRDRNEIKDYLHSVFDLALRTSFNE